MPDIPASLLIVDADREFGRMLAGEAAARGYRADAVVEVAAALGALEHDVVDALVVDLAPDATTAFDLLAQVRSLSPATEIVVMSSRMSMASTIQWFDPDAFAFVRKSDVVQVFAAVARALERRRMKEHNRRLLWELRTINDIASGIARSLEVEEVLAGALQGLVRAMDAAGGSIHLVNRRSGAAEPSAVDGAPEFRRAWLDGISPAAEILRTRRPALAGNLPTRAAGGADPCIRSVVGVPLVAGAELLGALTLGSERPRQFESADQELLGTIGGQLVVAIQNARLHRFVLMAKREWEQTFDAISDPIGVFDSSGELLRGNRALARHLQRPVTELRGLSCAEVGFCGPDACGEGERCALQHGARREVALPDGQIFSVTTFPVGLPGRGASVVQVAKNVTEEIRSARRLQQMSSEVAGANARLVAAMDQLRATQMQLLQAEKLSAIGHLVAGVAHELNNPLTSVIGYAQLLEEEFLNPAAPRDDREVGQDLRRIAEEAERAARIVRNLLAFARRQGSVRAPQDVAEACGRVLALREYELRLNGIELETDLPPDLPLVHADGGQLQQVLLNLCLNAEQAMRDTLVRRLSVSARYDDSCDAVELTISDTGHGIDGPNLSRVFDPFFTTRDVGQGAGLGLSICYGIVRDHGGTIRVESTSGAGTTCRVTLPARLSDASVGETEVLVANLEQGEREFVASAFRGWGYRTTTAATVQEALTRYSRAGLQIAVLDRSVVAADVEAWKAARAADDGATSIILTSVRLDDHEVDGFARAGGMSVLAPPTALPALRAAVRTGQKECV